MIILNINGPINSGKSTISHILAQKLSNSIFIEVDDLVDENEFPDFKTRINERLKRLYVKLDALILDNKYDYVIFAYPMSDKTYKQITKIINEQINFIVVTLNPKLEMCLTNRGNRELTDWEQIRIKQMYEQGFNTFSKSNLIIDNTIQTPEQTVSKIMSYLALKP